MSSFRSLSRRDFLKAGVALTSTTIGSANYGDFVLQPTTAERAIDAVLVSSTTAVAAKAAGAGPNTT